MAATIVPAVIPPLNERPIKNTICLFDVDGPLTKARQHITPKTALLLSTLRQHCAIGFVGGSDLSKQQEQLSTTPIPVTTLFDFCFSENGLTAYRMGQPLSSTSFIAWLGESKYKRLVNFCLHYIADLDIPIKRGTFIEFRNGMINVSPVGRNATIAERDAFNAYDAEHDVRRPFVAALQKEFADFGLTYSIGGQISFDVFPQGWDKTFCLRHVEAEKDVAREVGGGSVYETIHFFGDKTMRGGNDFEIFSDGRTVGHTVVDAEDTARQLKEIFEVLRDVPGI